MYALDPGVPHGLELQRLFKLIIYQQYYIMNRYNIFEFMHSQYYYYISIMHPAFSIYYTHYNATCQVIFLDETYYIIYIYI